MKKTYTLEKHINTSIKKGDRIYLTDGSALTALEEVEKEYFIVFAYPEITGREAKLKDIEGTVIQTGIEDSLCSGTLETFYLQDIIVKIGNGYF